RSRGGGHAAAMGPGSTALRETPLQIVRSHRVLAQAHSADMCRNAVDPRWAESSRGGGGVRQAGAFRAERAGRAGYVVRSETSRTVADASAAVKPDAVACSTNSSAARNSTAERVSDSETNVPVRPRVSRTPEASSSRYTLAVVLAA